MIKELESQVAAYRSERGVPVPTLPDSPSDPIPSVLSLLSQIVHLRKELLHIESICTDLTEKVEWVNSHYPQLLDKEYGDFKIITLPDNPSHARRENKNKQEAAEKEKENHILRIKVEELKAEVEQARQQGGGSGGGGGAATAGSAAAAGGPGAALSSSAVLELESSYQSRLAKLESEKVQLEKKGQRLKEVFGQKVAEFRNTCYLLTGFKIELIHSHTYRLKSMYAEAEADHLLFQQTPPTEAALAADKAATGGLSVMETDFTAKLDSYATNYLQKSHSIPGFLAAVTLQLLDNQTKAT